MHTCQQDKRQFRTARFNVPVSHRSMVRRLLDQIAAPSMRLHRYRNLSAEMLEDSLDAVDRRRCE
ncbi:MAG: hypothetical protein K0U72_12135 [Gammaproteobacteria bacterium]|nr:hypothetical protein [Gammaproteobacteria bacterium]